jgi:hypothetical protein
MEHFVCGHCGRTVPPSLLGSHYRNHCPACLRSLHLDIRTGDRRSGCRGVMDPIGIWVKDKREWALLHRCRKCGFIRANRIAGDDNEVLLLTLAALPLSQLPFPAGRTLQLLQEREIGGGAP